MRQPSYNKEVQIATAQFIDVFNDIIIQRKENETLIKEIVVPCVYGARSRVLKSAENRNKTLKPPLIVASITGINRDPTRVHSVNDNLFFDDDEVYNIKNKTAVPINIAYEVSLISKFHTDMDQMICNFVVHFNPDIYVVWPCPIPNHGNMKSQIVWDGDINIEYPIDLDETRAWRIFGTTTFRYKTWFFPGIYNTGYDSTAPIKNININQYANSRGQNRWYSVPTVMTVDEYLENAIVSGLISKENYDELPISNLISSNYFIYHYATSGSDIIYPTTNDSLSTLIQNAYSPDLRIYSSDSSLISSDNNIEITDLFDRSVFVDVWYDMLSGNISGVYNEI
jgi:hypothetical protein